MNVIVHKFNCFFITPFICRPSGTLMTLKYLVQRKQLPVLRICIRLLTTIREKTLLQRQGNSCDRSSPNVSSVT